MFGSDLIVRQLARMGIDRLALNPGATLRWLHESLLDAGSGVRPITCLHEGVAVGMAHGYAKAAGRPMGVGLHDTVGVLNAALGTYNAWVDAVPMLILGGVGPLDATLRRPWIDWVHTTTDTPRPIRDSLVWADTPTSVAAALESLRRGNARARSSLAGPAYVGLDQPIQEATLAGDVPSVQPAIEPWRAGPDPSAVERVSRIMAEARRPAIVLDRPLGDLPARRLVAIAEHLGAALVELEGGASVPWGHPLDRSTEHRAAIGAADVLLLIDVRDPGLVTGGDFRDDRRVLEVSAWPLRDASWMVTASSAAVTERVVAEPGLAIDALAAALGAPTATARPAAPVPPAARRPDTGAVSDGAALDRRSIAVAAGASLPLERVVVAHGALGGHARAQLRLQRPSQYLGRSGGEGLGYALPASLGAALAHRGSDRVVVSFLTDGDTLYLPQALWTAAHEGIPLLAIVDSNRSYARDELHQRHAAQARGRDPEVAARGVRLDDPPIDLVGLARSMGVEAGDPVTSVGELRAALARALDVVGGGSPFLIEARTAG